MASSLVLGERMKSNISTVRLCLVGPFSPSLSTHRCFNSSPFRSHALQCRFKNSLNVTVLLLTTPSHTPVLLYYHETLSLQPATNQN